MDTRPLNPLCISISVVSMVLVSAYVNGHHLLWRSVICPRRHAIHDMIESSRSAEMFMDEMEQCLKTFEGERRGCWRY